MKKIFLIAAIAASFAFAQARDYKYASPIGVEMISLDLATLRSESVNDAAYLANLTALQKQLDTEKNNLAAAKKSLQQEKKLYDMQLNLYKQRKAQLDETKKHFATQSKQYDAMRKNIKKQFDIIKKIDGVSSEAIQQHTHMLNDMDQQCKEEDDRNQNLLEGITKTSQDALNEMFNTLNDFQIELTEKETLLKNMEAQNKSNSEIVKNSIKALSAKK
ncbi:MAG: hypothetical protein MJZ89_03310 [Paludibacteraceae bacterium]|nr:hypothetical protein [Paludibacteraceae bacterium]